MSRRFGSLLIAVACVVALGACEGPEGPTGPAGATGPAGPAGPVGPAGADANENCTQCHTSDVQLLVRQLQYQQSTHRLGGNYTRNGTSCAVCHTHQGFLERLPTNALTVAASVTDPAPINCRTCHMIHDTYTSADYAFTTTSPVTFWNRDPATGMEPDPIDFGDAAGNLCASCHQARPLYQRVLDEMVPTLGGPDIEITSFRYGYHYGPQGQVVSGTGAYEFTGSETIVSGPTTHGDPADNEKLCATCHMAAGEGVELGGHTWRTSFESNGEREPNVAGCNTSGCHTGFEDFTELGDVPAEITALLEQIDVILVDQGIKQELSPGYTIHDIEYYAVTGTWDADLAAALANWNMFTWDRSRGLHNPAYARAVLTNTLEFLQGLPAP